MRIRRYLAHNLFEINEVWRFDPLAGAERHAILPRLAGLKIECEDPRPSRDLEAMNAACTDELKNLLARAAVAGLGYRVWLFVAHAFWQPDSRTVRYKGLWKIAPRELSGSSFRLSAEVVIKSSEGLRYAGL